MKDIRGTIKFNNTNLVKKTLGTGAFILVANASTDKTLTIICSVGAGLMIANIVSKLKQRRNEVKTSEPKKTKRSILVDKLKELKTELLETKPELSEQKTPVVSAPKAVDSTTKMDFNNPTEEDLQDMHYLLERAKANGDRLGTPKSGNEFGLRTEKEMEILKNREKVTTPKRTVTNSDPLGEYIQKQKQRQLKK